MSPTTLLAVPNVSEGRDAGTIEDLGRAFERLPEVRLIDVHSDPDHHRSVFTLAGPPGALARALADGARETVARIDLRRHQGVHPRIGALDVAPIVHLHDEDLGAACAEALVLGDLLGEEIGLPVFLYGSLGAERSRADLRRGGLEVLAARMAGGELRPDFGPDEPHPSAGAVLVSARPPLVAFNIELAPPAGLREATEIAAAIRDSGSDGLPGLRALGLWLEHRGVAQVSMNVEDPVGLPLAKIVSAIAERASPARAELVGLAPQATLDGFPSDLPLDGVVTIEDALVAGRQGSD